jgi:hemerythrin-like domain-containing protein
LNGIREEDILFPAFEQKTNIMEGGPTAVMRMEHRQIAEHLEAIHQKVKQSDPRSDEEENNLLAVLKNHNDKEENILYPAIDRLLNEQECAAVFEKMESIPEERYATCCSHA